jgi:hypothetical protein
VATSPDGSPLDAAAGFRVGLVRALADGLYSNIEVDAAIQQDRLVQVVVRFAEGDGSAQPLVEPLRWDPLALGAAGDSFPGRRTVIAGRGGESGAALAFDGIFVGRLERAGGGTTRARFLEDPGFVLRAVLLRKDGPPLQLRRVRTRTASGRAIVMDALDRSIDLPAGVSGILLSAAGDSATPKGLVLGNAQIRGGEIHVEREFWGSELAEVVVATGNR